MMAKRKTCRGKSFKTAQIHTRIIIDTHIHFLIEMSKVEGFYGKKSRKLLRLFCNRLSKKSCFAFHYPCLTTTTKIHTTTHPQFVSKVFHHFSGCLMYLHLFLHIYMCVCICRFSFVCLICVCNLSIWIEFFRQIKISERDERWKMKERDERGMWRRCDNKVCDDYLLWFQFSNLFCHYCYCNFSIFSNSCHFPWLFLLTYLIFILLLFVINKLRLFVYN